MESSALLVQNTLFFRARWRQDVAVNLFRSPPCPHSPAAKLSSQRAGLDMASPAPYQAVVATFKDTLDQAEALIA